MKYYRLWINTAGDPLYVEVLDGTELPEDTAAFIRRTLDDVKAHKQTVILSAEWELRVLAA